MPERIVTVERFEQLWREEPAEPDAVVRAGFLVECSSGTYVRSLIADLGDAYCVQLRRTAIGPFDVADAVAPPRTGRWEDPPFASVEDTLATIERFKRQAGGKLKALQSEASPARARTKPE